MGRGGNFGTTCALEILFFFLRLRLEEIGFSFLGGEREPPAVNRSITRERLGLIGPNVSEV